MGCGMKGILASTKDGRDLADLKRLLGEKQGIILKLGRSGSGEAGAQKGEGIVKEGVKKA